MLGNKKTRRRYTVAIIERNVCSRERFETSIEQKSICFFFPAFLRLDSFVVVLVTVSLVLRLEW